MKLSSNIVVGIEGGDEGAKINGIINNLQIVDLNGNDRECDECMTAFKPGEEVVIIGVAKMSKDYKLEIPVDTLKLCHIIAGNEQFCLEDFTSRFLQSKGVLSKEEKPQLDE